MANKEAAEIQKETTRPFSSITLELEEGQFHSDISEEIREICSVLSQRAADVGKAKGELNIKLKFSTERGGTVTIVTDLTTKLPKQRREPSTFWLTKDNNLSTENPKQLKFTEIKSVGAAPTEIRRVGTSA